MSLLFNCVEMKADVGSGCPTADVKSSPAPTGIIDSAFTGQVFNIQKI